MPFIGQQPPQREHQIKWEWSRKLLPGDISSANGKVLPRFGRLSINKCPAKCPLRDRHCGSGRATTNTAQPDFSVEVCRPGKSTFSGRACAAFHSGSYAAILGANHMRFVSFAVLIAVFSAIPLAAQEHKPNDAIDQVVSKVIAREKQEMAMIRQHSPLVETYIQKVRVTENDGSWVPDGDHYFIGRAEFSKGLDLKPLPTPGDTPVHHTSCSLTHLFDFGTEFLPDGFLQMIYLDNGGLDTQNYNFDYVRREFLGEVRTLVFDVTPTKKGGQGPLHRAHLGRGPGFHDRSIQRLLFRPQ